MKSYDFDAATYDADCYCVECLPNGITVDDVDPIFADSEWDSYPVCCKCKTTHDYVTLTFEGLLWKLYNENLKVFFSPLSEQTKDTCFWNADDNKPMGEGFYYWFCSPGCLPEGDPIGPFKTRQDAENDAVEQFA